MLEEWLKIRLELAYYTNAQDQKVSFRRRVRPVKSDIVGQHGRPNLPRIQYTLLGVNVRVKGQETDLAIAASPGQIYNMAFEINCDAEDYADACAIGHQIPRLLSDRLLEMDMRDQQPTDELWGTSKYYTRVLNVVLSPS